MLQSEQLKLSLTLMTNNGSLTGSFTPTCTLRAHLRQTHRMVVKMIETSDFNNFFFCWQCSCLNRVPIWSFAKLILTCWLVIPYFSGAAYVYEHFVRPVFVNPQSINIWYVPKKMDIFRKPDDMLTAAEKYIAENGPDAFQKILSRVMLSLSLSLLNVSPS